MAEAIGGFWVVRVIFEHRQEKFRLDRNKAPYKPEDAESRSSFLIFDYDTADNIYGSVERAPTEDMISVALVKVSKWRPWPECAVIKFKAFK